jgi:hypothetical protein
MIERFLPDERHRSIFTIDYESLWRRGRRGLIFDLDNTLGPQDFAGLDERVWELIAGLRGQGFRVGLVSNHRGQGRDWIQQRLDGVPVCFSAKKPLRSGIRRVLQALELHPAQTAMIGDQLFTDIWGAKRCGLYTILVEPLDPSPERLWTRGRRWLERKILQRSRRRAI